MQQRHSPIKKHRDEDLKVDWARVGIVAFILVMAIGANAGANIYAPHLLDVMPVIGVAVWVAIVVASIVRRPNLGVAAASIKGTLFLMSLVLCASLMPVEKLPLPSWQSALGLGFVSSVFDNIPLTALALKQGGFDWGFLPSVSDMAGRWYGSAPRRASRFQTSTPRRNRCFGGCVTGGGSRSVMLSASSRCSR